MSGTDRSWPAVAVRGAGLVAAAAAGVVLVDRAADGASLTRVTETWPVVAGAGPWWVVLVAVALLAGTGALPAWRMAGARPLAVFLAPCLGAVVAAVSAVVTVAGASEPLRWYVAFAAAVNAAALASTAARSQRGRTRSRAAAVATVLSVAIVVAFGASALGRVATTAVARATWLPLTDALVRGHHAVHPVLTSSATAVRLLSSPLGAGCASVTWLVTGVHSVAAAVSVLVVVAAAAVGAAACAIGEVGPACLQSTGGHDGGPGRARGAAVVRILAVLVAVGWCLAAFGVAGRRLLGGDLTLLWAGAAVGAGLLTLVLPPTGWRLRAGMVLAALAVLTAPAGTVAGAALVLLVALRRVLGRAGSERGAKRLIDVAGTVVALAAVAAWPVVAAVAGAGPPSTALPPSGVVARLHAAWRVIGPELWPVAAAGVVAVVATAALGRRRRDLGLPTDAGLVAVGLVVLAATVLAHGWATALARPLLVGPAADAAPLPLLLASALMAVWVTVGAAVLLGPVGSGLQRGDRSDGGTGTAGAGRAVADAAGGPRTEVDGRGSDVLHPSA